MKNACRMRACLKFGACWCKLSARACMLLDACLVHACGLNARCMLGACWGQHVLAEGRLRSVFLRKQVAGFCIAHTHNARSTHPVPPFAEVCVPRQDVVDALPGAVRRGQVLPSAIVRCCVPLFAGGYCRALSSATGLWLVLPGADALLYAVGRCRALPSAAERYRARLCSAIRCWALGERRRALPSAVACCQTLSGAVPAEHCHARSCFAKRC
jgi:hypothetical protein